MARQKTKSSIITKIEKNFDAFLNDDDYKKGIKELDKQLVHNQFEKLKEEYSKFIKFYVYRRKMKYLKVLRGKLSPRTERNLVNRGKAALKSYHNMINTLKKIEEMWQSSGVIKAIDRHTASVCKFMIYNPKFKPILDEFRKLRVPRDAINWLDYSLRESDYDLLRFEGGDGTFSGLVKRTTSLLPVLEKSVQNMEKYGVPTIEGAGDDKDEYVEAGAAIATAIIVGLIFGFCMKWD